MKKTNLSEQNNLPDGSRYSFGIVVSEWNSEITNALLEGCRDTLLISGVKPEKIEVITTPGSYELPQGAAMIAQNKKFDAIITLGCVIKGETSHNEYINTSVAILLNQMAVASGIPHIFGLLTPNDYQQAVDRAGGKHGNKGIEAAATALKMADLNYRLSGTKNNIGFKK